MILAGDIGGTKALMAVFDDSGDQLKIIKEQRFASRNYRTFDDIVKEFAAALEPSVDRACFGIAGVVKNGRCTALNLPWVVNADALAKILELQSVGLINDLEANAHGLSLLGPDDYVVLNPGAADAEGNVAVIAAGTGLGEAGAYWDGNRHHPFACEGGHVDFAPRNELEIGLFRFLQTRFGTVSYERVLSGPGILNIYEFLRETRHDEQSAHLADEIMQAKDPPAVITRYALEGSSALCVDTMDLFVSIYGAETGNLALKVMARGGVFIGGGIAPRIIEKLEDEAFMRAFYAKGRLHDLLRAVPVRVILNEKSALFGAAQFARIRSGTS